MGDLNPSFMFTVLFPALLLIKQGTSIYTTCKISLVLGMLDLQL